MKQIILIAAVLVLLIVGLSATAYEYQHRSSCDGVSIEILTGNIPCEVYSGRVIEG